MKKVSFTCADELAERFVTDAKKADDSIMFLTDDGEEMEILVGDLKMEDVDGTNDV